MWELSSGVSKTKAEDFYVPSLCLQPTKKSNLVLSSPVPSEQKKRDNTVPSSPVRSKPKKRDNTVPSKRKKRDNTVPSLPVPSKQKIRDNLHNQRKELLKRIITSSREKRVTKEIMISKSVVINSDDCEKCQSGLWIPDLNLFSLIHD